MYISYDNVCNSSHVHRFVNVRFPLDTQKWNVCYRIFMNRAGNFIRILKLKALLLKYNKVNQVIFLSLDNSWNWVGNTRFEIVKAVLLRFRSSDLCAVLLGDSRCFEGTSRLRLHCEVVEEEGRHFAPSDRRQTLARILESWQHRYENVKPRK